MTFGGPRKVTRKWLQKWLFFGRSSIFWVPWPSNPCFFRFPCCFVFRFSWLFFSRIFLPFPRTLGVPRRVKPLFFFGVSLAFFPRKQGLEGQGHFWVTFPWAMKIQFWAIFEPLSVFCSSRACSPIGRSQCKLLRIAKSVIGKPESNSERINVGNGNNNSRKKKKVGRQWFGNLVWEKLNRGVSKPGGFPLISGKVQIVSRTLSGLFLVGALHRPRKRKRTNRENPRTIPEQIGKIPEKSGKS